MAHFNHQYADALNALAGDAMDSEDPAAIDDVLGWEADHPQQELPNVRIALLMAKRDFIGAKSIIDALLEAEDQNTGIEVLGMYVDLLVDGQGLADASAATIARLQSIAGEPGPGQGKAQSWLASIRQDHYMEEIILPNEERAIQAVQENASAESEEVLTAYPNPSNGNEPVYLVARLPEGMEQATVRVMDATGRLITDDRIGRSIAIVEVGVHGLASGLYVAVIFAGGVQVAQTKFEVAQP